MSQFKETTPEQLNEFLNEFRELMGKYPNIHDMFQVSRGALLIEVTVLDELNNPKKES